MRRAELDAEFVGRLAQRIREIFPACAVDRSERIAMHACRKYSGRVGRSAAAKRLGEHTVRLAVAAHVRLRIPDHEAGKRGVHGVEEIVQFRGDDHARNRQGDPSCRGDPCVTAPLPRSELCASLIPVQSAPSIAAAAQIIRALCVILIPLPQAVTMKAAFARPIV